MRILGSQEPVEPYVDHTCPRALYRGTATALMQSNPLSLPWPGALRGKTTWTLGPGRTGSEGVLNSVRSRATVLRPGSDRIARDKSHQKGEPSWRDLPHYRKG